jgi:pentatricopeptide repeat protein
MHVLVYWQSKRAGLLMNRLLKVGGIWIVFFRNSLVDTYAKFGSMEDANKVFNEMPSQDVVTWNVMICGYVKCGQGQEALELFQQMQQEGLQPAPVTFVGVLNSCASLIALEEGRCIHKQIIESD